MNKVEELMLIAREAYGLGALGVVHEKESELRTALTGAVSEWLPVDQWPKDLEVRKFYSVLVDYDGDPMVKFLDERNGGVYTRYKVFPAKLRHIDRDGWCDWCLWELPSGSPIGVLNHVTHYQPQPSPPTQTSEV